MVESTATIAPGSSVGEAAGDLFLACGRFTRTAARLSRTRGASASWRAMAILEEFGPLRISEFAGLDRCSQPTATSMIKKLEEAGYAQRTADPEDGRAWLVSITTAGSEWLQQVRAETTQLISRRLSDQQDVSREQVVAALLVLTRLTEMINEKGDAE